jgi:hypothetical protein
MSAIVAISRRRRRHMTPLHLLAVRHGDGVGLNERIERSAKSASCWRRTAARAERLPISGFAGTPEEIEHQWYSSSVYRGRGDSMRQLTWRVAWMLLGLSLGTRQARLRASVPV